MDKPKNLNISRGIFFAFGMVILLYAAFSFHYFQTMENMSGVIKSFYEHPLVVSNASLQVNINVVKIHHSLKDALLINDKEMIEAALIDAGKLETETFRLLRDIEDNILGTEGKDIAKKTILLWNDWKSIRKNIIEMIHEGRLKEASRATNSEEADHVTNLEQQIIELMDYDRNKASTIYEETERVNTQSINISIIFLMSLVGLSFIIAFLVIKRTHTLEHRLEDEKEMLGVTLKSIGDGVIATDKAGDVILINPVAEDLTGWLKEDAIGQNIRAVFNIVNEKTRNPCENPVEKVLETNGIIGLANHTVLVSRNGTRRAIADSGAPIRDQHGKTIGVVLVFRDQTEERLYRNKIQESEKKHRLLAENTLDVIWTMNLDLEFTYVNPAIADMTGYSPEEWIGSRLPDHCDEENFFIMANAIADEIAKGKEMTGVIFEAVMLKKNRELLPVEIHGKIICDDRFQPIAIQGTTRDISERRQAEAARHYQDRLLREMGDIAKIGGWEFDPVTGKGTWTDEVARIHDIDPGLETNMEAGLSYYREDSRKKIDAAVKAAVESGKPYDLELELISARGRHKWVRTIGQPKTKNGKVVQVRGAFQDITLQKKAEQHIEHLNQVMWAIRKVNQLIVREQDPKALIQEGCRLLVDNRGYASALIVLTDDSDKPLFWAASGMAAKSDALDTFLGNGGLPPCCAPLDPGMRVIHPKVRHSSCSTCPIFANLTNVQSLCVQMVHEGILFGYLIAAMEQNLVVDDEELNLFAEMAGDIAFALKVLQTNLEHKESERRRKSLEGQLIQAQKMESIGRLAGGIAHDYNNMLSVIIGYAELALDRVDPENPLYNDLEEILAAAVRSTDITRQLLAFARRQTVAPKVLDLNETVERMLKMLRRLIGEDIDLFWLPETKLWPVKIDPAQVDQILANLCVNARDAITGIGKVSIKTENVIIDKAFCNDHTGFIPGEYVVIAVTDNGSGMAPEILDAVFEPFFTTKVVGKGTGLGLSTVYGIVKQNNGFITAESEPGKGTTFKIYFPRQLEPITLAHGNSTENMLPSRGETVLVVEDEEPILKITQRVLDRLGYSVLSASTPGQAMALAKNHPGEIHLLITDVVMPEMNGRDLADQLAPLYPGLKILFMSGYTANVIAHRGILEEGVSFISKPFSQKDLSIKVRDVLDQPKT